MTILRSGTTQKYSDNWGAAFGQKKSRSAASKGNSTGSAQNGVAGKKKKKAAKKKAAKKKAAKKKTTKSKK